MTRTQLISAFLTNAAVKHLGRAWTIEGLTREDGSGFCFIVQLQSVQTGERKETFIRTHDHPHIGHPEHTLFSDTQTGSAERQAANNGRMLPRKSQML